MTSLREIQERDRRLVLLRGLADAEQYTAGESVLDLLLSSWGHAVPRAKVQEELQWLENEGLLTLRHVGGYSIATINKAGLDVATGQATHDGIARPGPGA